MLGECIDAFRKKVEREGESFLIDEYGLSPGTYIMVGADGSILHIMNIEKGKGTAATCEDTEYFRQICFCDYHSRLISMNKKIASKSIHSNNYLTFWVKKESIKEKKLSSDDVNDYFSILKSPASKYSGEKLKLYRSVEAELGPVDEESLEFNRRWVLQHIFMLDEYGVPAEELEKSGVLRIYFEADPSVYEMEDKRYLIPNMYINTDYDVVADGEILGVPSDNLTLNPKKPFLVNYNRKVLAPYLLNCQDALLQKKFFDYMGCFLEQKKYDVYVDLEHGEFYGYGTGEFPGKFTDGLYLRLQKGLETSIIWQEPVTCFENELDEPFTYHNYCNVKGEVDVVCGTVGELEEMINSIFFSKMLKTNYFSEDVSINDITLKRVLFTYRMTLFEWLHLGNGTEISEAVDRFSLELVKNSILSGYMGRAAKQINLRLSFMEYFKKEGDTDMTEKPVELRNELLKKLKSREYVSLDNDEQYYFAVGQMVGYLNLLEKGTGTKSMINAFLNAKTDKKLKDLVRIKYKRYNYLIPRHNWRTDRLMTMIQEYSPAGEVRQDVLCMGYTMDNMMFEKMEREEE